MRGELGGARAGGRLDTSLVVPCAAGELCAPGEGVTGDGGGGVESGTREIGDRHRRRERETAEGRRLLREG